MGVEVGLDNELKGLRILFVRDALVCVRVCFGVTVVKMHVYARLWNVSWVSVPPFLFFRSHFILLLT